MPKNPELQKVWEQRIADYRKSGQTQVNWCKENQWSIHQFKYWLRKIENPIKTSMSNFTPHPCMKIHHSFP